MCARTVRAAETASYSVEIVRWEGDAVGWSYDVCGGSPSAEAHAALCCGIDSWWLFSKEVGR